MLYFQESLMLSLNNDIKKDVVYFDFTKAFDSVKVFLEVARKLSEFTLARRSVAGSHLATGAARSAAEGARLGLWGR